MFLLKLLTSLLGFGDQLRPFITESGSGNGPFPLLLDATLEELRIGLGNGLFTSVDLVNAYIARINETISTLNAVTEINPDAIHIAAALDAIRRIGTPLLGPLHGIPILVKDNIATDDAMNTTAGSYALLGAKVPQDSFVIAKLRKAGAIILGKTNMSQWASARSRNTSEGWSAYGGQTYGAYFPGQDPSGSSSGSGVASSMGLAWASLGTETAGSITIPCSVHNLVGIKPTVGLTSRHLVVPISARQDTVGPMARTVRDAAHLLSAIAGLDPNDNYTSAIPFKKIPDYVAACDYFALRGKRIGIPRNAIDLDFDKTAGAQIPAFNSALEILRGAGAEVVDGIYLPGWEPMKNSFNETNTLSADLVADVEKYFSRLLTNPQNITSLASLRNFTQSHPLEEYPERDTAIWDGALSNGINNTSPAYWKRYNERRYYAGHLGFTGALRNYSLDALILPAWFAVPFTAVLGLPIVTVPLGRYPDNTTVELNDFGNLNHTAPNLPFGISFVGEAFSEELLIGLAYAFEQRTMRRKKTKPYFQPKTELVDVVRSRLLRETPTDL